MDTLYCTNGSLQSKKHQADCLGAFGGSAPQTLFPAQIVLCPGKFVLNINKNKNIAPLKIHLARQTLKRGYGPGDNTVQFQNLLLCFVMLQVTCLSYLCIKWS